MHVWKRRLAKYSRWLHIYTSMTSFVIVFFFAVTGWTLNHADRFSGRERPGRTAGAIDSKWTNTGSAAVNRAEVIDAVKEATHVSGAVTDFRTDDDQVTITFKGPGYSADATVDRRTGKFELIESRLGLIAIANDLHKGRDTGDSWKLVIDISAALLTFVSLTGLVLIYFIHKHRLAGLILLAAGGVLVTVLYTWAVP